MAGLTQSYGPPGPRPSTHPRPPHPPPPHLQHEEEEYTQSIIDYFNTGLLSLPEGTTLRAYLAEKLKW